MGCRSRGHQEMNMIHLHQSNLNRSQNASDTCSESTVIEQKRWISFTVTLRVIQFIKIIVLMKNNKSRKTKRSSGFFTFFRSKRIQLMCGGHWLKPKRKPSSHSRINHRKPFRLSLPYKMFEFALRSLYAVRESYRKKTQAAGLTACSRRKYNIHFLVLLKILYSHFYGVTAITQLAYLLSIKV